MRTRLTTELHDHARRQYEHSAQPVSHIALDVGVDESVIRRMAKREEWVRYVAAPRDLPPVAKLLAQVEELEASVKVDRHPEVLGEAEPGRMAGLTGAVAHVCRVNPKSVSKLPTSAERTWDGAHERAPQGDGESTEPDAQQNIARFTQVVMAHLDEFEAVRRAGKLIARQHLPTARAISILTEAFNKLQRLRAAQPGQHHDDISDMPADLDEYRLELTRRIQEFLRSRPAAGADGRTAVEPAEGV
jgi:hypothetical protein